MSVDRIVAAIAASQAILVAIVGPLLDFVDNRGVVRRCLVGIVAWLLVDVYLWAKGYSMRPGVNGLELAAVITAMNLPITALTGFIFKMYDTSRQFAPPAPSSEPSP